MARALIEESIQEASKYRKISFEEFLRWDGDNQHVEWVDGEVVEMSPVSNRHTEIVRFIVTLLSIAVRNRLGGRILFDPFVMKTGLSLPGRAPDILYVRPENLDRLKKNYLEGPADLVVEVISPGSKIIDSIAKRDEYEVGGVSEYWLIDTQSYTARFYVLQPGGKYFVSPLTSDGYFESVVMPGVRLKVEWLWEMELPLETDVLREWGLI